MDVIFDLHWSDRGMDEMGEQHSMPDANSVIFWQEVAEIYQEDSRVLFELYNEPYIGSWEVWLNGGQSGEGFVGVGMQDLYDAVRDAGAENIVIIGGLTWASDLSEVPSYRVQGYNIVYAAHPYDHGGGTQLAYWETAWGFLAATDPVLLTEFGNYNCNGQYYADVIDYAASKGIGWTAWAWYPGGCEFPALIEDWRGTPSVPGEVVRAALQQ